MIRILFSISLYFPFTVIADGLVYHQDSKTGLLSWEREESGFSIRLIQLHPDFVGATYGARGLPSFIVDKMMSYCVFGTIVRNVSQYPLIYHVSDWRYIDDSGLKQPVKTKTNWVNEWKAQGVAFRWTILPDNQRLDAGDWNQGFTTFYLPPGSEFDVIYSWTSQAKYYEKIIKGIKCVSNDK